MEARLLNTRTVMPSRSKPCEPEVKVFSWDDDTCVAFDPNSLCAVHVPSDIAGRIQDNAERFSGLLYSRIAPTFGEFPTPVIRKVVLNVTHGCNLSCAYCFAKGYTKSGAMSIDTAFKALDMFSKSMPLDVSFFGGEPLLAWDTIMTVAERVHQIARERKVGCKLHVTTNATRIDGLKAAALRRFGFSVLASLDGPEEIHNAARPAKKGNSYYMTMRGIENLNDVGIRPMIRCTFRENDAQLVRRLEYFEGLMMRGMIQGVSIEPAILAEGCGATPGEKTDSATLQKEWHGAASWYVERIKAGRKFEFFYFRKLLGRIMRSEFHGCDCGAGRGYITVDPTGNIFACHREAGTHIGHLNVGFDDKERGAWFKNRVESFRECDTCWARYVCGGGCPQNRITVGGEFGAPMPHVCEAKCILLREIFWILAQLTREEAERVISHGTPNRLRKAGPASISKLAP